MSFDREERRVIDKNIRWGFGRILLIVLAVIVVVGLISVGGYLLTLALSGPKGQGDGIIKNNSSENWIKQQAKFEELYAEYESTQVRIDAFKITADANPQDPIAQTNYNGQVSHCTNLVSEYNAATRSFLSEDWKSIDLPPSLDADDCTRAAL